MSNTPTTPQGALPIPVLGEEAGDLDIILTKSTCFEIHLAITDSTGFPYTDLAGEYVVELVIYSPATVARPTQPAAGATDILLSLASNSGTPDNPLTLAGSTIVLALPADEVDALADNVANPNLQIQAGMQVYLYPEGHEDQRKLLTTGRASIQESAIASVVGP